MHCTAKKTLDTVLDSDNDLIVQVKGNQPKLRTAIAELAAAQPPRERHVETDPPARPA